MSYSPIIDYRAVIIPINAMALIAARFVLALALLYYVCAPTETQADTKKNIDSDGDGLQDHDELRYGTDPFNADTDGDGYSDWIEALNGYSPLTPEAIKLTEADSDQDGLTDAYEISIGTNPAKNDTDGDGFDDRTEIEASYDPRSKSKIKLKKRIEVALDDQRLRYYLGDMMLDSARVSTGKPGMPTPVGEFQIVNKSGRAWSGPAQLWMPYWMGLGGNGIRAGKYGIHELPEWPGGRKEGEDHLGTPVSGGCIRLGTDKAKLLYDWTPIGTKIIITKS
ncbi:L,D-transpeptidase family protein [Candidatus Uhrbacteria bacterium]|nr:L,D-transpeptidase family protein [Candidatus Uhrbacteria bacterium]